MCFGHKSLNSYWLWTRVFFIWILGRLLASELAPINIVDVVIDATVSAARAWRRRRRLLFFSFSQIGIEG
jgi:hypothetical protein